MSNAIKQTTERVPYYELAVIADGGTVKTFSRKIYKIRGLVAKELESNEVIKLPLIYYEIRTVQNKYQEVVAKRKNPKDELKRVYN
ncbi:hypothetical protein [Gracilibacillus thailandensis]|uniref:Uncharacterized protein n=2 Tax=Gracilibacillus thailandensis TaxID=563735 RepID=A0A6N7QX81_9BACI|nr:hypothetical protein [Gracilibacillus thailandensis]MRI66164.1 hypothetical protein [Gracilibacillus thailandensis]